MSEKELDLSTEIEQVSTEFDTAKKVVELMETFVRKEEVSYDVHIERLQSLRFLYLKLVEWKDLKEAAVRRLHSEGEPVAPEVIDVTEDDEFDPTA